MKYLYVRPGESFDTLPARDLNDADLSEEQKALLARAVELGIYKPAVEKKAKEGQSA